MSSSSSNSGTPSRLSVSTVDTGTNAAVNDGGSSSTDGNNVVGGVASTNARASNSSNGDAIDRHEVQAHASASSSVRSVRSSHIQNFRATAGKLISKEARVEDLLNVVAAIRNRIEVVHSSEYRNFLQYYFPAFKHLLNEKIAPQFSPNHAHKVRLTVLEIFTILPSSEILKPYVKEIMSISMTALKEDNQENALLCLKIIFSLHKHYNRVLKEFVPNFLKFVRTLYSNIQGTKNNLFGPLLKTQENAGSPSLELQQTTSAVAIKSTSSFNVVTECPLTVMLLFQLYPEYKKEYVKVLVPLMISALELSPPKVKNNMLGHRAKVHIHMHFADMIACQVKTLSFLTYLLKDYEKNLLAYSKTIAQSVVNLLKWCPRNSTKTRKELLVATRHILAKNFRECFLPYVDTLLNDDILIGAGRELKPTLRPLAYNMLADLVYAVRSMLKLEQIKRIVYIFSRNLHSNELSLVVQTMSARLMLNLVDHIFHNDHPAYHEGYRLLIHILSTLVDKFESLSVYIPEVIQKQKTARKHAEAIEATYTESVTSAMQAKEPPEGSAVSDESAPLPSNDTFPKSGEKIPHIMEDVFQGPPDSDSLHHARSLIKTMILGLKTVVWCISNYAVAPRIAQSANSKVVRGFHTKHRMDQGKQIPMVPFQLRMIAKFVKFGLRCFTAYPAFREIKDEEGKNIIHSRKSIAELQDILESFASVFTVLKPCNFSDIFSLEADVNSDTRVKALDLVYQSILANPEMIRIPRTFLANESVSRAFACILLEFLLQPQRMKHLSVPNPSAITTMAGPMYLEDFELRLILEFKSVAEGKPTLGPYGFAQMNEENMKSKEEQLVVDGNDSASPVDRSDRARAILRLFKLTFESLSLFERKNESVFLPQLCRIISMSMHSVMNTQAPVHYLNLLRALFRSLGGGKFEHLYKELLRVLPGLLKGLVTLQRSMHAKDDSAINKLLIELCLSVPARLPSLLKHLPLMMTPIVSALKSPHQELIMLSLRTIEFWLDNLNIKFLHPIFHSEAIENELMNALTNLLKPSPMAYGEIAMRVLGKLGGSSRQFLIRPQVQKMHKHTKDGLEACFNWGASLGNSAEKVSLDKFIELSSAFLERHFKRNTNDRLSSKVSSFPNEDDKRIRLARRRKEAEEWQQSRQNREEAERVRLSKMQADSFTTPWMTTNKKGGRGRNRKLERKIRKGRRASAHTESQTSTPQTSPKLSRKRKLSYVEAKRAAEKILRNMREDGEETDGNCGIGDGFKMGSSWVRSHYKKQAYNFLAAALSLYIDLSTDASNVVALARSIASEKSVITDFEDSSMPHRLYVDEVGSENMTRPEPSIHSERQRQYMDEASCVSIDREKLYAQHDAMCKLLKAVLLAVGDKDLSELAQPFAKGFVQHLTLIVLYRTMRKDGGGGGTGMGTGFNRISGAAGTAGDSKAYADPLTMCDAIFDVLSSPEPDVVEVGTNAIKWIHEAFVAGSGSHEISNSNILRNGTLWNALCETLCNGCHHKQWRKQMGACIGIYSILRLRPLPVAWIQSCETRILESLFHVLKNHLIQFRAFVVPHCCKALELLMQRCHNGCELKSVAIDRPMYAVAAACIDPAKSQDTRQQLEQTRSSGTEKNSDTVSELASITSKPSNADNSISVSPSVPKSTSPPSSSLPNSTTSGGGRLHINTSKPHQSTQRSRKISHTPQMGIESSSLPNIGDWSVVKSIDPGLVDVIKLLINYVGSTSAPARSMAQILILSLSQKTGIEPIHFLAPCRDLIHSLIFGSPLQLLLPAERIAKIHATIFVLTQTTPRWVTNDYKIIGHQRPPGSNPPSSANMQNFPKVQPPDTPLSGMMNVNVQNRGLGNPGDPVQFFPDMTDSMMNEMDVISLLLRALSLIDGDLGKLGDILRKFSGCKVKADRVDGEMCISIEAPTLIIDALFMALEECEVAADINQSSSQNQVQILRLFHSLPGNFSLVLSRCLQEVQVAKQRNESSTVRQRHSLMSRMRQRGLNLAYPFDETNQDRLRIATLGLIRSMLLSFPDMFSARLKRSNVSSRMSVPWSEDDLARFDRVLRAYGISSSETWNHIASTLGRTVEDCQVKLRENLRDRCLSMCCNSLTSTNKRILKVAKQTFATLIVSNQDKVLPNNPLKKALRPVLKNLANFQNLTIPLLESLARVLELLSRYFKDSLGDQLLQHLQKWIKPDEIFEAKKWRRGQEPLVAAKIIDLFQLLPESTKFLEPLIKTTINLEKMLPSYRKPKYIDAVGCSPFRKALIGYLNRYPTEACQFFLSERRLSHGSYSDMFESIISSKYAGPIRAVLSSSAMAPFIINATFRANFSHNGQISVNSQHATSQSNQISQAQRHLTEVSNLVTTQKRKISEIKNRFALEVSQVEAKVVRAMAEYRATKELLDKVEASKGANQANLERELSVAHRNWMNTTRHKSEIQARHDRTISNLERSLNRYIHGMIQAENHMGKLRAGASKSEIDEAVSSLIPPMNKNPTRVAQVMVASVSEQAKGLARKHAGAYVEEMMNSAKLGRSRVNVPKLDDPESKEAKVDSAASALSSDIEKESSKQPQNSLPTLFVPPLASNSPSSKELYARQRHEQRILLELRFQGAQFSQILSEKIPNWLPREHQIMKDIIFMWRSAERQSRLKKESYLELRHCKESKLLLKCLQSYCIQKPKDIGILFEMLSIFSSRSVVDYSFLKKFCEEFAMHNDVEVRKNAIDYFLKKIAKNEVEVMKVHSLRLIILPMLAHVFKEAKHSETGDKSPDEIIDVQACVKILTTMLESGQHKCGKEMQVEMLRFATLLIENMRDALTEHRKELIKFAWNHLKSTDPLVKHWAYVNVCSFIAQFDTPAKIVLQVYVALLRSYQEDSRVLVSKALSVLVPALPKRLHGADLTKAIQWTKKVIFEEMHSLPQLVHVWKIVIQNPDIFYRERYHFIPQMVNSLNRLGLPPNCSVENRALAVDLAELIVVWEQNNGGNAKSNDIPSSTDTRSIDKHQSARLQMFDSVIAEVNGIIRKARREQIGNKSVQESNNEDDQNEPTKKRKNNSNKTKRSTKRKSTDGKVFRKSCNAVSESLRMIRVARALKKSKKIKKLKKAGRKRGRRNNDAVDSGKSKRSKLESQQRSTSISQPSKNFSMMIDILVNFLIRIALMTAREAATRRLSQRSIRLLAQALQIWPLSHIKTIAFQKLLDATTVSEISHKNSEAYRRLHAYKQTYQQMVERYQLEVAKAKNKTEAFNKEKNANGPHVNAATKTATGTAGNAPDSSTAHNKKIAALAADVKRSNLQVKTAKLNEEKARSDYKRFEARCNRGRDHPCVLFASLEVLNTVLEFEMKLLAERKLSSDKSFILNNAEQIRGLLKPCLSCASMVDFGELNDDLIKSAKAAPGHSQHFVSSADAWYACSSLSISKFKATESESRVKSNASIKHMEMVMCGVGIRLKTFLFNLMKTYPGIVSQLYTKYRGKPYLPPLEVLPNNITKEEMASSRKLQFQESASAALPKGLTTQKKQDTLTTSAERKLPSTSPESQSRNSKNAAFGMSQKQLMKNGASGMSQQLMKNGALPQVGSDSVTIPESSSSLLHSAVVSVPNPAGSVPKANMDQAGINGQGIGTKSQTYSKKNILLASLPHQLVSTEFYPHVFHLLSYQLKRVYIQRTEARKLRSEEFRRRSSQNLSSRQAAQYDRSHGQMVPSYRCSAYVALKLISSMGKISRAFVVAHTQQIVSLMECIAIDLPYAFTRPASASAGKTRAQRGWYNAKYVIDPKLSASLAKEPTEACKAFVLAMNLMSMNLTNMKVECFFQEGMVEVRQVFLRILGHLISHCKTIYALEAVVAVLRRWILGRKKQATVISIPALSSKVRVLPEMLSDNEKEVFLKKLHQFVMRFRETPRAIPLMTDYLDIVYQLSRRYNFVPKSISKISWLHNKMKSGWISSQTHVNHLQSSEKKASRSTRNKRRRISSTISGPSTLEAASYDYVQDDDISPTLRNLLQKPFTSALLSPNPQQRHQFYTLILEKFGESGKLSGATEKLRTVLEYDWEPVAPRFWLPQASGCLLSGVADGSIVELAGSTPGFESFLNTKYPNKGIVSATLLRTGNQLYSQHSETSRLISSQGTFLTSVASLSQFKNLFGSLQELSNADAGIAIEMWEQLFPSLWDRLPQTSQATLVAPLTRLVSQAYHSRQLALPAGHGYRRNIVKVLLGAIAKCKTNRPILPPELLKYLGCAYNDWYDVMELMEERFLTAAQSGREDDADALARSLELTFQKLNWSSWRAGLRRVTANSPETSAILDLIVLGKWTQAQEILVKAMGNQEGRLSKDTTSPEEAYAWGSDWVHCAKELGQWNMLKEHGVATRNPYVMLDAVWKLSDWNAVKVCFNMPAIGALADCQLPDCRLMLYQIYSAIFEGRTRDVHSLCKQGVELVLQRWQSLPGGSVKAETHSELLQIFQNLVELQESCNMMQQISRATANGIVTQMSGRKSSAKKKTTGKLPTITASSLNLNFDRVIHTWRSRLPNAWEPLSTWANLLIWRKHIYHLIVQALQDRATSKQITHLHDSEWTQLKLAHVARNQNSTEYLRNILGISGAKVNDPSGFTGSSNFQASGNSPAFYFQRLREKLWSMYENPSLLVDALRIANAVDISHLQPWQCGELLALKALILERMHPDEYHSDMLKAAPESKAQKFIESRPSQKASSISKGSGVVSSIKRATKLSPDKTEVTANIKTSSAVSTAKGGEKFVEKGLKTNVTSSKMPLESKNSSASSSKYPTPSLLSSAKDNISAALKSFSASCSTSPDHGQLWIQWAQFYDRQLHKVTKGMASDRKKESEHAIGVKPLEGLSLKYAMSAMSTYMQAIHCKYDSETRLMLARVLRLLKCGDPQGKLVATFASHVEQSPMWCWITWIPQLLESLSKPEAVQAFSILYGLSNMFPQAVYHSLRCFLLKQRSSAYSKVSQPQQNNTRNRNIDVESKKEKGKNKNAEDESPTHDNDSDPVKKSMPSKTIDATSYTKEAEKAGLQLQDELEKFARSQPASATINVATQYISRLGHVLVVAAGTLYSEIAAGLPERRPKDKTARVYAEELMAFLRKTHSALASETESLLGEVITRFKPGPEQELLSAVCVLKEKCFQIGAKAPTSYESMNASRYTEAHRKDEFMMSSHFMQMRAPKSLMATLERVGERYFKTGSNIRNPKVKAFGEIFRERFFEDFVYHNERGPPLLVDILDRLEVWRRALRARLEGIPVGAGQYGIQGWHQENKRRRKGVSTKKIANNQSSLLAGPVCKVNQDHGVPIRSRSGPYLALERRSKLLASFSSDIVEIPGQYVGDVEPQTSLHSKIFCIESNYEIVQRPGLSRMQCRLTFVGDNGSQESFLVQYCVPSITPTDERAMQLTSLTNRLLLQHNACRRLYLQMYTPLIVPIAPRVRLSREGRSFVSLDSIYERDCDMRGVDVLAPCIAMIGASGATCNSLLASLEECRGRRLNMYMHICENLCNPASITQYLSNRLLTAEARWTVRNQLSKQWAMSSILSHVFHVGQRSPSKFIIGIDTGSLLSLNFRPEYHRDTGHLLNTDKVPFRLTPSIQHLMSPIGVQGVFAESMMCMADGLHDRLDFIEDLSTLFFTSDMMPWYENYTAIQSDLKKSSEQNDVTDQTSSQTKIHESTEPQHKSDASAQPELSQKQSALNYVERVDSNVSKVLQRIREVAPLDKPPQNDRTTCGNSNNTGTKLPSGLNQHIHHLIRAASSPENLSMQSAMWEPYF